jgi:hypothetical protein
MDARVQAYLDGITSPTRRRDAETMIDLMRRATGLQPTMWGGIVGFGQYHYKYDLTAVDRGFLETIVSRSFVAVTAGTYAKRAREGGMT